MIKPEVQKAIGEVKAAFPDNTVSVAEDSEGGAFVIVDGIDPGEIYEQRETWIGFRITFQYPCADVYPHFVRQDLSRKDKKPLGEATSTSSFRDQPAIQLSRRSNHLDPKRDTALVKLHKVLHWLRTRP